MKAIKLISILLLYKSCVIVPPVYSQQDYDGLYQSENGSKISINKGTFQLTKINGSNTIVKTSISDGTVNQVQNNILEFNSISRLNKYGNAELKLNIDEYKDYDSKELKIKLLNFDKIKYELLDVELNVIVTVGVSELGNYNLEELQKSDFSIKIDADFKINTFVYIELIMFSKCIVCAAPKTNALYEYEVFSEGNNVINLRLEKYSNLFNYLFLNNDYAILKNKKIMWDGLVYKKIQK